MRLKYVASIVVLIPWLARAWSIEGHQIIAIIAETRLNESTWKQLDEILGKGSEGEQANISDAEVCGWADEIRRQRRDTAPYHFVNIPHGTAYNQFRLDQIRGVNDESHLSTSLSALQQRLRAGVPIEPENCARKLPAVATAYSPIDRAEGRTAIATAGSLRAFVAQSRSLLGQKALRASTPVRQPTSQRVARCHGAKRAGSRLLQA